MFVLPSAVQVCVHCADTDKKIQLYLERYLLPNKHSKLISKVKTWIQWRRVRGQVIGPFCNSFKVKSHSTWGCHLPP